MTSRTTITSSQWQPLVVDATQDEVPSACPVDIHGVADPEYYTIDFDQAYTVNVSAADAAYADFSIKGAVSVSGQSFLDVLSSKLAVSGVVLQGEWSQSRDGLCAYFAFSGTVSLEPGVMTLTWNAGSADGTQDLDPALLVISAVLTWANDASISSGTPAVSIASSTTVSVPKTTVTATPTSGTTTTSISAASSHSSKNLHVLVPAIVVPIVALLLAGFALLFFLRRRRRRMAPSAAFREDHLVPETDIAQVQSTSNLLVASGSASRSLSPHFPLDGKRPMLES